MPNPIFDSPEFQGALDAVRAADELARDQERERNAQWQYRERIHQERLSAAEGVLQVARDIADLARNRELLLTARIDSDDYAGWFLWPDERLRRDNRYSRLCLHQDGGLLRIQPGSPARTEYILTGEGREDDDGSGVREHHVPAQPDQVLQLTAEDLAAGEGFLSHERMMENLARFALENRLIVSA